MDRDTQGVTVKDEKIVTVKLDQHVLDPESEEAVQVTSDASQETADRMSVYQEGPPTFEAADEDDE